MKNQIDCHTTQFHEEIRALKEQLRHEQEKNNSQFSENELIQALDKMPDCTLYRLVKETKTGALRFYFVSGTWAKILGVSAEDAKADIQNVFQHVEKTDLKRLKKIINESLESLNNFKIEVRYYHPLKKDENYWIQISSYPRREGEFVFVDGFVFDITARKIAEKKLITETESLQNLNTEMKYTSDELSATNEELSATNEEFAATTEELHKTNAELERYRVQLEEMVEDKTKELTASQENLLSLSHRQALFIKVLQTLHLEDDLTKAMNMALALIGEYTNVSRMQIWENNSDGVTYGVTYEWCNNGVEPSIHYLQNIPLEYGKPWFDMLLAERMICTSDISILHPAMIEILQPQGVKSIVVLPLAEYGMFFGYISFTVTEVRIWEHEDVELLKNIAQIVSNTSKRYQAKTVIKQSQQVMRTVLDNIDSNIFVTDCETSKILFANKAFLQETGKDVEGEICWQALQAGLNDVCNHCPKSMLLDKNKRPNDLIHFWEDYNPNTKRWYTIASKALEWVDGRSAIMELATDISERKQAEMELVRAKEKAEESDNLKSSFLANMSHEIRTPINGITGFLHFLNDDNLTPQRRQEYINIINNSSIQLVKLIDDIIDVAKIEARQMNINPIPVHINNLMEELYLFFETSLQNKNKDYISLILDDSEFVDNCVAYIDSTRLRQIITNLINNAIKYTEKGYIRFGYRQLSSNKLEFVVEDTGIGIKHDHQEVIFERFRQAELTNNRMYGGAGLGLSISRSLAQMMGGDLYVKSTEDEGSSFSFTVAYLPVTSENEHFFNLQTDKELQRKSNHVVVIIEPEIMKFRYLEKFLAASGFSAQQAVNITQGIDIISKTSFVVAMMIDSAALVSNDDEVKLIKTIRASMPIIWIGDKQNGTFIKAKAKLKEPVNHEDLLRVLKGLVK